MMIMLMMRVALHCSMSVVVALFIVDVVIDIAVMMISIGVMSRGRRVRGRHEGRRERSCRFCRRPMDLHVLSKGGRMRVTLVASLDLAVVGFVRSMDVRVFLSVRGVGESTITSFKFTLEWLLSCFRCIIDLKKKKAKDIS
jgi:hypothetical protein